MDLLKKIIAAVLLLSFIVFVAFFGRLPALRYFMSYISIHRMHTKNFPERLQLVFSTALYVIRSQPAVGSSMLLLQAGEWLLLSADWEPT